MKDSLFEIPMYSNNYCLYDLTDGKILYQKNFSERTNIASLTKIMTTITAIEKSSDLNQLVTINEKMLSNIQEDASLAELKVGDVLSINDLLYASILPSGADATQALAYSLSGDIPSFVKDMNSLAKKIGMKNSNFVNVTGLDIDNHYSTIEDLLILLKYALQNETFKKIYETKSYKLANGTTVNATINFYKSMMNVDVSRIIGSKTGYTKKSGVCIASLFETSGHEMLFISTQAKFIYGDYNNLKDNLNIINFMDNNYSNKTLVKKNETIKTIDVKYSNIKTYDIKLDQDLNSYLPNDYSEDNILIDYDGLETISFLDNNKTIGKLSIKYNNDILYQKDIIAKNIKINNSILIFGFIILVIIILIIKFILKRLS